MNYSAVVADRSIETVGRHFVERGHATLKGFFAQGDCQDLIAAARATRDFDALFLTEEAFDADPAYTRTNPRPGRNLAEKLDTDFVFGDPDFQELCAHIVGPRARILDYKFVMGVPARAIPDWVKARIEDRLVNNLGPYIRPEYRDITYFSGIDYHQDIIDFPDRRGDFITAYLYLDHVTKASAPLHLLSGSHCFGATEFPHHLERTENGYTYRDHLGRETQCRELTLLGEPGDLSFWHSTVLHGTQPQSDDQSRLSLRILIDKNQTAPNGARLDQLNDSIDGNLSLSTTRRDLTESGSAALQGNVINREKD